LKVQFVQVSKQVPKLIQFILASLVFCVSTFSIGGVFAGSASAETFTVSGNKSLNTNGGFRLIDGNPRLSLWDANAGDNDQQFNRLNGNRGGILLQNRTTGKCINAHYIYNDGQINVWPCDANDIDQNWDIIGAGVNQVVLRRTGTNHCIDAPNHSNAAVLHMWDCSANDNQKFAWSGYVAPAPAISTVTTNSPLYEYWIVARKKADWSLESLRNGGDYGHAFNAIVKKDRTYQQQFQNGVAISGNNLVSQSNWYRLHTYGYYNNVGGVSGVAVDVCQGGLSGNDDCLNTNAILRDESISSFGWAVRKARISEARANYIDQNRNTKNCQYYSLALNGSNFDNNSPGCNCVDYATRQWYTFTAQREDFMPKSGLVNSNNPFALIIGSAIATAFNQSPNILVDRLNSTNNSGSFFDNGNTWQ
jgi:Ricin-type beta-trefoil lectin domain